MALELASREVGLDKPLRNPPDGSPLIQEPGRLPRGPRPQLREYGRIRTLGRPDGGGLRDPTSALPISRRDLPLYNATKPLQSRGDRDRTPVWMAVITVGNAYPRLEAHELGTSSIIDITMRGPTG